MVGFFIIQTKPPHDIFTDRTSITDFPRRIKSAQQNADAFGNQGGVHTAMMRQSRTITITRSKPAVVASRKNPSIQNSKSLRSIRTIWRYAFSSAIGFPKAADRLRKISRLRPRFHSSFRLILEKTNHRRLSYCWHDKGYASGDAYPLVAGFPTANAVMQFLVLP
jgi:hypothetical protein